MPELTEFRARRRAPDEPRILLLVDGFPAFRGQHEAAGQQGSVYLTFQRILAEGRSVGVHVAMSADRPASVPVRSPRHFRANRSPTDR